MFPKGADGWVAGVVGAPNNEVDSTSLVVPTSDCFAGSNLAPKLNNEALWASAGFAGAPKENGVAAAVVFSLSGALGPKENSVGFDDAVAG